jgi:hypothetical protein
MRTVVGNQVDSLDVRDAFLDDVGRLAHQRHLQSVGRLPRPVALDLYRHLAARGQQLACRLPDGQRGFFAQRDFH